MRSSGTLDEPSATVHSHICWVFQGRDDLHRGVTAFLEEGAERGERLLYLADAPSPEELYDELRGLGDVGRLVDDGSLVVDSVDRAYQAAGGLDPERQLRMYRGLAQRAVDQGYTGLRIAADGTPLATGPDDRRHLLEYEFAADRLIAASPMSALCAYDRSRLGADVAAFCAAHPQHRSSSEDDPGFRLFHDAGALRLVGEIDISNRSTFSVALDAAEALAGASLTLDIRGLDFIDGGGLASLARLADRWRLTGRDLQVTGASATMRNCCDVLFFESLAAAIVPAGDRP